MMSIQFNKKIVKLCKLYYISTSVSNLWDSKRDLLIIILTNPNRCFTIYANICFKNNDLGDVSKMVDNQLIAEIAHMLKVMHDSVITKKIYNIVLYIYNSKNN